MATPPLLSMDQPLLPGRQFPDLTLLARGPVTLERRIVWGGRALYEYMPPYGCPGELQKVPSRAFVAEHPPILAFGVEYPPVLRTTPSPPFVGVGGLDIAHAAFEHPLVDGLECFFGGADPEVVRPAAQDRV